MVSKAHGFTKQLRLGADKFLALRIAAQAGRWRSASTPHEKHGKRHMAAKVKPPHAAIGVDEEGMDMRPPGLLIEAELAGIEVSYRFPLFTIMIIAELDRHSQRQSHTKEHVAFKILTHLPQGAVSSNRGHDPIRGCCQGCLLASGSVRVRSGSVSIFKITK